MTDWMPLSARMSRRKRIAWRFKGFRDWLALKIAPWRRVPYLADPVPNLTTKADIDNLDIIWSEKNPAPDEVTFRRTTTEWHEGEKHPRWEKS